MIEQLSLTSFKSHKSLHVNFTSGLNLITGSNYVGKSTILHGILFAFFGVSAVPGGSKKATTRGCSPSSTKAIAQFYHGKEVYRIERKISSARLYKEGILIASSTSAVNKRLEEVFSIPQKFFMKLKYAEQGETQAMLTLGVSELHKIVEHVSGASLVNAVIVKAASRSSAAEIQLDTLGPAPYLEELEGRNLSLIKSLNNGNQELEQCRMNLGTVNVALQTAEKELKQATEWNAYQRQLESKWQSLQNQIHQANENKDHAKKELMKHKVLAAQSEELGKVVTKTSELMHQHEKALADMENYCVTLEEDVNKCSSTSEKVAKLAYVLDAMEIPDVTSMLNKKTNAKAMLQVIRKEISNLETALKNSVCVTCNRPFEGSDLPNLHLRIKAKERDEHEAKVTLERVTIETDEAVEAKEKLDETVRSREEAFESYKAAKIETEKTKLSIEHTEQLLHLLLPCPTPEQLQEEIVKAGAAQQAVGAYQAADRSLGIAQQNLNSLTVEQSDLGSIEDKVNEDPYLQKVSQLKKDKDALSGKVSGLSETYRLRYAEWESLQKELKEGRDLTDRINSINTNLDVAKGLGKYLRNNRDRFMQQVWDQITRYASDFSSSCTGGKIEQVERTSDGEFQFMERDEESGECEVADISGASGAQKSIMAIGIQLAMDTLLMDSFGALLFDEPASQLDGDHAMVLTQALASSGKQIILVSHRELDAAIAQSHIHLGS